jgi:hypothetical protein
LIERDYLQIHRLLFDPISMTRPDVVSIEDAVVAVKWWLHGQRERSLLVLDSADAIDDFLGSLTLEAYMLKSLNIER